MHSVSGSSNEFYHTWFLLFIFLSVGRSAGEDHVEEGSNVMTNSAHDARQAQNGYECLRASSKKVLEWNPKIFSFGNSSTKYVLFIFQYDEPTPPVKYSSLFGYICRFTDVCRVMYLCYNNHCVDRELRCRLCRRHRPVRVHRQNVKRDWNEIPVIWNSYNFER